jgi:hypothetical protein
MKRPYLKELVLLSLAVAVLAGLAQAQGMGHDVLTADIPFSFTVEKTTLPAGKYEITQMGDQPWEWYISGPNGMVKVLFSTEPAEASSRPGANLLVFDVYGDKYFLSKIWLDGEQDGFYIAKLGAERAMMKKGMAKTHTVPIKKKSM